ncbi:MAG: hypothetical protein KIT16_04560 [Rhodospirillaceae bacterium]|nr:hypothetical protein [Rhodospirillaceae bacterium]
MRALDWLGRHPLLKFMLGHCLVGIAAGWSFVAGMLAFDVGGLAALIFGSASPGLALALLLFGTAVTFGGVAMGGAIMSLGAKR